MLKNSSESSILQAPKYREVLRQLDYKVFDILVFDDGIPVSYMSGKYKARLNVARTMAVGGLVGGCPVVADGIANKPEMQDLSIKALNEALSRANIGSVHLFTPPSATTQLSDTIARNGYAEYNCKYSPVLDIRADKEQLWKTIDRKNRNVIRYAIKSDVKVEVDNSAGGFDCFYRLYADTADRKHFRPNSYRTMRCQFDALARGGLCDLWLAKKEGEVAAGAFIWKYRDIIYFAYGASSLMGWKYKASNLLHWEIITRYGGEGYGTYNMWEGSTDKRSPMYAMTAFKLSFGAKMVPTREYRRVNKKALNFILSLPPKKIYEKILA